MKVEPRSNPDTEEYGSVRHRLSRAFLGSPPDRVVTYTRELVSRTDENFLRLTQTLLRRGDQGSNLSVRSSATSLSLPMVHRDTGTCGPGRMTGCGLRSDQNPWEPVESFEQVEGSRAHLGMLGYPILGSRNRSK